MKRDHLPGTILTFALGAGIGAAAALLFAPNTGEELRGNIAEGVSNGVDQARRTGKDLRQRAQNFVGLAKDCVQDAMETGDKAYSQAKNA
ncbi:MAG: YtxH domain-containing protein [Candidatus Acidiferrales bacterium]